MASEKYGRLFTFRDVVRLINAMTHERPDEQLNFEAVVEQAVRDADGEPLTFPADEPLFLLRGQDALAPDVVREYALTADWASHAAADDPSAVNLAHREAAWKAADGMRRWQDEHPDRVKIAD